MEEMEMDYYCLRWENHHPNMFIEFNEYLQSETFTDVTLVCDDGNPIKCHRIVLAACSPYFKNLFTDLPCDRPVVVLKDLKYIEIKAILQYMYRGEVNVAQDHLAAILKVAEALRVNGVFEENRSCDSPLEVSPEMDVDPSPSAISTQPPIHSESIHYICRNSPTPSPYQTNPMYTYPCSSAYEQQPPEYKPTWAPVNGFVPTDTPFLLQNNYYAMAVIATTAMFNSACNVASSDLSAVQNEQFNISQTDTSALQNISGREQVSHSQSVSLDNCHPDNKDNVIGSSPSGYGSIGSVADADADAEDLVIKRPRTELLDHAQSTNNESKSPIPSSSSAQPLSQNHIVNQSAAAIANYVHSIENDWPPQQRRQQQKRPKWKCYRLYTNDAMMAAIQAVRSGDSVSHAATKFRIPPRTLYDKIKKLGITTRKPFRPWNH